MSNTLVIRADGSPRMGTGHVMRCLALAQEWQQYGPVVFACAEISPSLATNLESKGCQLRRIGAAPGGEADAAGTVALAREQGAACVVLDGYQFDSGFYRALREAGLRLLVLDDYGHAGEYDADLILNQNLGAEASLYVHRAPQTRLLLGPDYALLRRQFQPWRGWIREIRGRARKILITLGGSDPDNVTGRVIQALRSLPDMEAVVLVGGSNPHVDELRAAIRTPASQPSDSGSSFRIVVDAADMPELMAWADLAVAAGGSTSWETAFMGLPSLVLTVAGNQTAIAAALAARGIAISLGWPTKDLWEQLPDRLNLLASDAPMRTAMSEAGRACVDGLGAERVCKILREVPKNDSAIRVPVVSTHHEDCHSR